MLRAIADRVLNEGVKPIEVLLHNMRYYHHRAENTLEQVMAQLENGRQLTFDEINEVVDKIKAMDGFRELATMNAEKAASFVHPRLSAVAVNVTNEHRFVLPDNLSIDDAMARYEDNVKRLPRTINGTANGAATPVIPLPKKDSDDGGGMAS